VTHWLFNLCFRSSSTTHVGRWGAKSFQITRAARGPFWEATVRRTDDSTPKACLNLVDLDSAVLWVVDTLDLSPPPEGWDGRVHTTHEPVVFDNVVLGFKTDRYHIDTEGTWSNISTAIQEVECPKCHARKGEPCISTNTGMGYGRLAATHRARVLEAGGSPPLDEGARRVTTTQLVKWFRSAETPELPLPAVQPVPAPEVVAPEPAASAVDDLAVPTGADVVPVPEDLTLAELEADLWRLATEGHATVSIASLLAALGGRPNVCLVAS